MRVQAKWRHVITVTREVDVDDDAFDSWASLRYGKGFDRELALTVWLTDQAAEVFADWRSDAPMPSDFELAYSEVEDASIVSEPHDFMTGETP